ncbi:MAG: NAD(P)/FAD-dependent oxidoreductase [Alistipes sp.]|nr:NAD(P)/FAD-dependent oxidoreductase [Alistipes sp.]
MPLNIPETDTPRIVIVGGGFAGLALIRALRRTPYQLVLIDKHNYHMFKPLLYQVASSALNVGDIAFPFRKMFQGWKNLYFRMAYIEGVDPVGQRLSTTLGNIRYDMLVLATGCVPNFFGIETIQRNALAMSNITDALNIRNRVLRNFEIAVTAASEAERISRLNVVIVGAGASGVEIAGALSEMRRYVMPRDYPRLDISHMHIYLIEGQSRVLPAMTPRTSEQALEVLHRKGIQVMLNRKVVDWKESHVVFEDGETIPTYNLIWTSGIKCSSIPGLERAAGRRGARLQVDAFNRVEGFDRLFAIGDVALMHADPAFPNGHPQLARVAISQGQLLARNLRTLLQNVPQPKASAAIDNASAATQPTETPSLTRFRYHNYGVLATVGRNRAFFEWKKIQFGGFFAWMTWSLVHIMFLLGIQGKLKVFWGWVWNYFGHDLPIRLMIGSYERQRREDGNEGA